MKTKVIVRLLSIGLVFVLALSMTSFTGEAFLENMDASAMYDLLEDALTDDGWMMFFAASNLEQAFDMVYENNEPLRNFLMMPNCAEIAMDVYANELYLEYGQSNYSTINKYRKEFLIEILSSKYIQEKCFINQDVQYSNYSMLNNPEDQFELTASNCGCGFWFFDHNHVNKVLFCDHTISLLQATEHLSNSDIEDRINSISAAISAEGKSVTYLSAPTNTYNCHAYAWLNSADFTSYWFNNPEVLIDDHHTSWVSSPNIGDIIVYYSDSELTHSGVVVGFENSEPIIESKWGQSGLYRHGIDDVLDSYYDSDSSTDSYIFFRYERYHTVYYSAVDDSEHVGYCNRGYCDYSVRSNHVYTLMSSNSNTHTYYCYTCGHTLTENHDYTSFIDSLGSGVTCRECNYTEYNHEHDYIGWEMYSETLHRRMCSECYYMEDEEHTFDVYHSACEKCGYAGPSILKKDEENYIE